MIELKLRNAISANYKNVNALQKQALINYEGTILNVYIEVVTELAKIQNIGNSTLGSG